MCFVTGQSQETFGFTSFRWVIFKSLPDCLSQEAETVTFWCGLIQYAIR